MCDKILIVYVGPEDLNIINEIREAGGLYIIASKRHPGEPYIRTYDGKQKFEGSEEIQNYIRKI